MKKRILSLLLAFLMVMGTLSFPVYAEGDAEAALRPEETAAVTPNPDSGNETEESPVSPCATCGAEGCSSAHETWCAICKKDDCGIEHVFCETCGAEGCSSAHETWCAICKKDDCGIEHVFCETCGAEGCESAHETWCAICKKDDCGIEHAICETCGAEGCESAHETWCEHCKKDDCGTEHVICETCGKADCASGHENWCEECCVDDCGLEHEEKIEIPPCSGAPTCWGSVNQEPLPNHVDGCARKDFIKNWLAENSAESVAAHWAEFTEEEQTDIIAMAEAYTAYAEALKALVHWGEEEEPPEEEPENSDCNCGITENVQYHAADCPLYIHWVKLYVDTQSSAQISEQWTELDKNTRESILAILRDNAPQKLEELKPLLPDMNIYKDASTAETSVKVYGDIPADVSMTASALLKEGYNTAILSFVPDMDAVLYAMDVSLLNPDGSKWQPYSGETVSLTLDAAALGFNEGERFRILHDHEGVVEDLGAHSVVDGKLSFGIDKFSAIYIISAASVQQNAVDGVIYFDLNAGNVTISGSSYSGFRFDGDNTANEVRGTLQEGQSYYVYQSDASNKAQTGLFNTGTEESPVYEMRLPQYNRVEGWASFITGNTDLDGGSGVINSWNTRAAAAGRSSAPNIINLTGSVNCAMVVDNVWSSYQQSSSQSEQTGAIMFRPGAGSRLELKFKGDSRFATIYYMSERSTNAQIIFAGDADSTVTVANLTPNSNYNYWKSAIGADDGSSGSADGIVFNSGYVFAGTNARDDCTAIGGGGNGYGGVIINGGVVTAVVSSSGAAIGGGIGKTSVGGQASVTINGGQVYAYNFSCTSGTYSQTGVAYIPSAAIGGGSSARATCNACTVNINGGYVFARSVGGTAIGGGSSADNHGGDSIINISGGIVDAASIPGTIAGNAVKAGASIGGGTGGTNGDGGDCILTITGSPTIYTGSIGGGKTLNTTGARSIGAATVTMSGGTMQGQVIMASGAASDCSFNMSGGVIDNTAALSGTLNADRDLIFTNNGSGIYHTYTFLEENGGAVYVENGVATLSGGEVQNTKATKGGAFYVSGGTFKMTGGSISTSSASVMGGAVCVEKVGDDSGSAEISSGSISGAYAPDGGAIAVSGGSFTMSGGDISSVKASSDGTAIDGRGGAVFVTDGSVSVSGGTVTGFETEPEAANGGGVYIEGGTFNMTGGSMQNFNVTGNGGMVCVTGSGAAATIQGGTISGNTASGVNEAANGGAVYVSAGGSFTIDGEGNIKNCNATNNGGGVYLDNGTFTVSGGAFEACSAAVNGGGVYLGGGSFDLGGSGSFTSCTAAQNGGGIYLAGGSLSMPGGSVSLCTAQNGGGVYLADGTFDMDGGAFNSCSVTNSGGGVYLAGGTFNMDGGSFSVCSAAQNGGAVCIMNGSANIEGGIIQGDNTVSEGIISANKAEAVNGGGIYVGGGKLDMDAGTISSCSASYGGAAYITAGECYMTGGTVSYNHAIDGGAMYVVNTPVTYGGLNNLTVEYNTATNNGGGMFIHNESMSTSVTNGLIRSNTAGNFGGGIYHEGSGGSCTVSGAGQIRANTAKNGGGLYIIDGSTLNVNGGHITENRALGLPASGVTTAYDHGVNVGVGGGVYVGPGTTLNSSKFSMGGQKAAGIYANIADFAADDLYANINATVLSLPNVDGMSLGDSMTATGWYCDYAAGDTAYADNTLINKWQFPNPFAVSAESIERYRHAAAYSDTSPYLVNESLGNVSGKYICLTIGSNIINFGRIVINKTGDVAADQYFIFRVQATSLENSALELPVFEVCVKGSGSVTVEHVPFGSYTVTELESWSWRYEVADGQVSKAVTVNSPDTASIVSFANQIDTAVAYDSAQQSERWLDGNSSSRVNVWNQKQSAAQGVLNLLGGLFSGKEGNS